MSRRTKKNKDMSYEILKRYIVLGLLITIFLLIEFIIYYNYVNYRVFVNDKPILISRFASLKDAVKKSRIEYHPGDLIDVKGKVIKTGQGGPVKFYLNYHRTTPEAQVIRMGKITVINGIDHKEAEVRDIKLIPFEYKVIGEGPYYSITRAGKEGKRVTISGEISKTIKEEKIIEKPADCVVVRKKSKKDRMIALTFDDGPNKTYTAKILDILKEKNVKATFFILGINAERDPAMLKRIVAEGHQIANHSFSHTHLTKLQPQQIKDEINRTDQISKKATGKTTTWLRPPGGAINDTVIKVSQETKHRIVKWTIDPQDWRRPSPSVIVVRVFNNRNSGGIVLLHDGGGKRDQTVAALPQIIDKLIDDGYHLTTLDDMFT